MAATQIKRVSFRHDAIIDWLLGNPGVKTMEPLCAHINVSRSWLSIVMNSDAFKTEYDRRRKEYNQDLAGKVQRKLYDVTLDALDRVAEALDDEEVDPRFALDAVDKATNRLGFGPSKGNAPIVEITQNTVHLVDKSLLQSARDSMKKVIDVEPQLVLEEGRYSMGEVCKGSSGIRKEEEEKSWKKSTWD